VDLDPRFVSYLPDSLEDFVKKGIALWYWSRAWKSKDIDVSQRGID
jgi:hypothetical protein